MRSVIALFLLAILTTAATGVAIAVWDGHSRQHDTLRAIHYDTDYISQSPRAPARR